MLLFFHVQVVSIITEQNNLFNSQKLQWSSIIVCGSSESTLIWERVRLQHLYLGQRFGR